MVLFAWKAAVLPWGSAMINVALWVIASHVMLLSRRSKGLLSALGWLSVALVALVITATEITGFGSLQRPFDLDHANLSGYWLVDQDLRKADLKFANLSGATLGNSKLSNANLSNANLNGAVLDSADLSDADLKFANLSGTRLRRAELNGAVLAFTNLSNADLSNANLSCALLGWAEVRDRRERGAGTLVNAETGLVENLSGAHLSGAHLSGAVLSDANLSNADLSDADLSGVKNLTQTQLDEACGDANTKLPEGLILNNICPSRIGKPCPSTKDAPLIAHVLERLADILRRTAEIRRSEK
jgi:uncharacterized protein YjbI with pentapeptide repeats